MEQKNNLVVNKCCLVPLAFLLLVLISCKQKVSIKESKFTEINTLSYTDVVYESSNDTVFISTFSGRIAERIKGQPVERVLIKLPSEIYSLAYDHLNHHIYASTNNSGIAIIDSKNKSIIKYLPIEKGWIPNIHFSENRNLLVGRSVVGHNYIWDLKYDYENINLPDSLKNFKVAGISVSGNILLIGNGMLVSWNHLTNKIEDKTSAVGSLAEVDASVNMLFLKQNQFQYYSKKTDTIAFKIIHKDWPYYVKSMDKVVRIPVQLPLTTGVITDKYIFTSGVDRSIRKWDKDNGEYIEELSLHNATISAMDLSADNSQLVSVDLKGGIKFYQIDNHN